jgi:ParB family transcriptional regulator, chromosome partitioning protein
MEIEIVKIDSLILDPNNARAHDEKNLKAIESSLSQFGQRKPIVLTASNLIVAGNGTTRAAMNLGWQEIAAVRIPDSWSQDQIKAFALADNRTAELAAWNAELLSEQIRELSAVEFPVFELGFEPLEFPTEQEWENLFDATARDKKEIQQISFTLHEHQAEMIQGALAKSKEMGEFGDTGNPNANGNALARIVELWLGSQI